MDARVKPGHDTESVWLVAPPTNKRRGDAVR